MSSEFSETTEVSERDLDERLFEDAMVIGEEEMERARERAAARLLKELGPHRQAEAEAFYVIYPQLVDRIAAFDQEDEEGAQKPIDGSGKDIQSFVWSLVRAANATRYTFYGSFHGVTFPVEAGSEERLVVQSYLKACDKRQLFTQTFSQGL